MMKIKWLYLEQQEVMEMDTGRLQIPHLLLGAQVLSIQGQLPITMKIMVNDLLMNMICMICQPLLIGVSVT